MSRWNALGQRQGVATVASSAVYDILCFMHPSPRVRGYSCLVLPATGPQAANGAAEAEQRALAPGQPLLPALWYAQYEYIVPLSLCHVLVVWLGFLTNLVLACPPWTAQKEGALAINSVCFS